MEKRTKFQVGFEKTMFNMHVYDIIRRINGCKHIYQLGVLVGNRSGPILHSYWNKAQGRKKWSFLCPNR